MTQTLVLQRVVLPVDGDLDVLPLYVEGVQGRNTVSTTHGPGQPRQVAQLAERQKLQQVLGRRRYRVVASRRTSFGTYFNAFPASYWRRWTTVRSVRLRVAVEGAATVFVYKSNAKGNPQRVESRVIAPDQGRTEVVVDLALEGFVDGGWYWFDVIAAERDVVVESAQWETDVADDARTGSMTVAVTTLNRPDDIVALLEQLGSEDELLDRLDAVLVVDQGTKHAEDAEGFTQAELRLGGRLRMIPQANLGGSGGFSRGMLETLDAGVSDYVLLSDDDVRIEPESLLRASTFADLAQRPTIVGSHMFSMYERSFLHSMGERVQPWRFWWGPVIKDSDGYKLDESSLRTTPELHRRIDVDYNGWWQTLIPVDVVRRLGLSMPYFIKWDDAEYGLRAKDAGIPTVSLPGLGVWHVPWTDKDDSLDWQAYYHQRNRIASALLHSPYERGGRLVRESMIHQLKHLLASQYSVAELRLQAIEDVLSGPEHLHRDLGSGLPRIREIRSHFPDAQVEKDPAAFPPRRRSRLPRKGDEVAVPEGRLAAMAMAALGIARQLRPVHELATRFPEGDVAAMDARWWLLAQFDSAVVSTSDGTGAAWYRRDPEVFRGLLSRSVAVHERLLVEWPSLAVRYRDALEHIVSVDSWRPTLGLGVPRSVEDRSANSVGNAANGDGRA